MSQRHVRPRAITTGKTGQRGLFTLTATLALATLAACGGGSASHGGPDGTPPQATGVSISPGTTMMKVGETQTFTAAATMSSGPAQPVQPAWKSDTVTILAIDGSGLARGVANGTATITATHDGVSGTRRMRVITEYQGTWAGDYVVRSCEATGDLRTNHFCKEGDGFWPGDQLPVGLVLTQDRDQVTGPLALGGVTGTIRGTINEPGELSATAALTLTVDGIVATFNVPAFTARGDGDRLTGVFSVDVTIAGASGKGHLEAELRSVARTAAVTAASRRAGSNTFRSWRELLQATKTRR